MAFVKIVPITTIIHETVPSNSQLPFNDSLIKTKDNSNKSHLTVCPRRVNPRSRDCSQILALDRRVSFEHAASCSCQRRGARGRLDMRDRLVTLPPYNPLPEHSMEQVTGFIYIYVSARVLKYCVSWSTSWVFRDIGSQESRRPGN